MYYIYSINTNRRVGSEGDVTLCGDVEERDLGGRQVTPGRVQTLQVLSLMYRVDVHCTILSTQQ